MRRSTAFVALIRSALPLVFVAPHLFVAPLGAADPPPTPAAKPVKVFILAGQSNMEGQGLVTMKDEAGKEKPGTLEAMRRDPAKAPLLKHLLNAKGEWAEKRDDVWVYDVNESGARHGPLEFGYGWDLGSREWFGPELQFGQVVGDHFHRVGDHFHHVGDHLEQQVLIIKTAWGGKDLYKDFRPPSAGGTVGPCYVEMIATVNKVVGDLKTLFPADAGGGFELTGFVWWHGWNDFCSPDHGAPEYETNLTHLIHDVRKDLKSPLLPVVVGEFTGPWGADCKEAAAVTIRKAQKAVAARPEFAGSVVFVATHDFVRTEKESPTDEGYHEFKNGETYFLIGDAFGKAMVALLR
jgi:alpha-galactosidase